MSDGVRQINVNHIIGRGVILALVDAHCSVHIWFQWLYFHITGFPKPHISNATCIRLVSIHLFCFHFHFIACKQHWPQTSTTHCLCYTDLYKKRNLACHVCEHFCYKGSPGLWSFQDNWLLNLKVYNQFVNSCIFMHFCSSSKYCCLLSLSYICEVAEEVQCV